LSITGLIAFTVMARFSASNICIALAAKAATDTIPIVFGFGNDPVQLGLVASLNRPGGNVTGMTSLTGELTGKQFGMLHELLPQASHFGFLSDSKAPIHELAVKDAQAAASAIGGTIDILTASRRKDREARRAAAKKAAAKPAARISPG
jgi:putative tryptophan/tyrosine transport system substrate-binding protein